MIEPDPVYRNRLVQQVINKLMLDGKKSVADSRSAGTIRPREVRPGARKESHRN